MKSFKISNCINIIFDALLCVYIYIYFFLFSTLEEEEEEETNNNAQHIGGCK